MIELYAVAEGRVQGVGFRRSVLRHAEKQELVGCVANCADGSVVIVAQGERLLLEAFVQTLHHHCLPAHVEKIVCIWREPQKVYKAFQILQDASEIVENSAL